MNQVLKPLYGVPSSARSLHFTLHDFLESQGFVKSGFEESIWIRSPDKIFTSKILVTAHINNTLIGCKSQENLNGFKALMLECFDCTDEGPVTLHLGCEIMSYRQKRTLKIDQAAYAERMLKLCGFWDKPTVKTPL